MMNMPTVDANAIETAILAGLKNYQAERPLGCCRVYVCISNSEPIEMIMSGDRKAAKQWRKDFHKNVMSQIEAGCKKTNKLFQLQGYGVRNSIYVGYDNNQGKEIGQGTAICANLKALGLDAYVEYIGD